MIQAPEPLIRSIEKLYMDITEPLDPYVALALTNLSVKVAEMAYLMGHQDGNSSQSPNCDCPPGVCLGLGKAF
ncbi:hypothetical protein TUMEXPCC7403_01825 [Tumidithrix helvetica PCC 7403]|uniref:Uncharacterized protein n=1 Tax=Tumidithrix elongata BACA0141 TaxID=2716417 RepID=A0AAW9PPB7_9CYAN|nr:hypothetical protein [Tumidithrix elongata RA019]